MFHTLVPAAAKVLSPKLLDSERSSVSRTHLSDTIVGDEFTVVDQWRIQIPWFCLCTLNSGCTVGC